MKKKVQKDSELDIALKDMAKNFKELELNDSIIIQMQGTQQLCANCLCHLDLEKGKSEANLIVLYCYKFSSYFILHEDCKKRLC